jgi:hypothetical protein
VKARRVRGTDGYVYPSATIASVADAITWYGVPAYAEGQDSYLVVYDQGGATRSIRSRRVSGDLATLDPPEILWSDAGSASEPSVTYGCGE